MKPQLLFCALVMSIPAIIFITSCAKEIQRPSVSHQDKSANQQQTSFYQQQQKILNLVASTWQKNTDGSYVNIFKGVLQYGGSASPVRVYLVDETREILISSGAITFMNGQLWSST